MFKKGWGFTDCMLTRGDSLTWEKSDKHLFLCSTCSRYDPAPKPEMETYYIFKVPSSVMESGLITVEVGHEKTILAQVDGVTCEEITEEIQK